MIFLTFFTALVALNGAAGEPVWRRKDPLAAQIEKQNKIALQGVLNNIGDEGSEAPGAFAGVIIASPSTENPNYFYTWTRDAALTMKMIVDEFLHGNKVLRSYIQDYVEAQAIIQTVSNPSGALASGRGLGEPKYYVNETRFNGNWGRPQRDGPALRATALITYGKWLLSTGRKQDKLEAQEQLWPVVRNDLNYVAQYWNSTGFDLWEEVSGSSFFTTAVQHRALVEGSAFAKKLGFSSADYDSQAPNILCFLQTYWNGKYAVANINTAVQRTGIDANTVLTSITTFDPEAQCDDALFQPCSPRALANLKVYVDSFRKIYTINVKSEAPGVGTGRYSEDIYFEGNPWYLTTLAVAEQLYYAIQQWSTINRLTITDVDLAFWQMVYPAAKTGTYKKGDKKFTSLLDAALEFADKEVQTVHHYMPSSGSLAEQYSRENGTALSARDLTWSYAAYVTMRSARLSATSNYPQVPSWGAPPGRKVPGTCVSSSVKGTYAPAIEAGAPPGSGGCTILVTFNLNASTFYGENVYLSGNTTDLGKWSPRDALPGNPMEYTEERPLWTFDAELPENSFLSYKYLRVVPGDNNIFETANRTYEIPPCPSGTVGTATIEDAWTGPTGTPS